MRTLNDISLKYKDVYKAGEKKRVVVLTKKLNTIKEYPSVKDAAIGIDAYPSNITAVCKKNELAEIPIYTVKGYVVLYSSSRHFNT